MNLENINLLKQYLIYKKGNVKRNYNIIFKSKPYLLDILNKEFNGLSPKEALYLLSRNMAEPPKCPICGATLKFKRNKYGIENVKRQYKSELYPFACDFYIQNLDLYIECNFHWTHGGHKFDKNNENDIKQLNEFLEWYNKQ